MSDRWQTITTVESGGEVFEISTAEMPMPRGPHRNQTHETCIFWDGGSYVIDRYHSKSDAEDGHEDIVERMENGEFEVQYTQSSKIEREDTDA